MERYNSRADLNATRMGRPLLGYDWIAGVLENEGLCEQSDETFQQVADFRISNRGDCVGVADIYE